MQASERLLALVVLLAVLGGCGDGTAPPSGPESSVTTAGSMPNAPYGVVAEVTYAGDVSRLDSTATVYLFLREKGSRMPLAVQYFPAAELPKRASLATGRPLANVELVVRLSKSGQVEQSPGDPQAQAWIEGNGHPPRTVQMHLTDAQDSASTLLSDTGPIEHIAPRASSVHALVTIESTEGLAPDAPVFVIARDGQNPMPLAVRKLAVRDLPAEVVLTDDDAMLFSHRLSGADHFVLLARVSPSGSATPSPGDPQSAVVTLAADAIPEQVALTISLSDPSP